MLKAIATSRVVIFTALVTALYLALRSVIGLDNFIILLNGVFVGAGVSFMIAFADLFGYALMTREPYSRVQQMALSMIIIWAAVTVGIASSIWGRATGQYITLSELTPIARYLAIVGGIAQITSPDVGQPLLFGRDRKLLLFAVLAGIVVAVVLIGVQT